jgi:hypothetical protein
LFRIIISGVVAQEASAPDTSPGAAMSMSGFMTERGRENCQPVDTVRRVFDRCERLARPQGFMQTLAEIVERFSVDTFG